MTGETQRLGESHGLQDNKKGEVRKHVWHRVEGLVLTMAGHI